MPKTVDLRTQQRYTPEFTAPKSAGVVGKDMAALHDYLRELLERFTAARQTVDANGELSHQGKVAALHRSTRKLLTEMDSRIAMVVPRVDTRISELESGLQREGERDAGERVEAALRQSEIRALFLSLDESVSLGEIRQALDNGDYETLSALLSAPKPIRRRLIAEQIAERVEEEVLRARSPENYTQLLELREALAVLRETISIVKSYLETESGLGAQASTRDRLSA